MAKETISLIVIGTELTRGIIQDRHGQLVSREVSHLGYHMNEIVAIPDDGSISHVLSALKKNNDIIIVTGGLGPTADDMTRSAIAEAAHVSLVKNEECWAHLYARVGERIHGANEKQAYIPEGFTPMPNPNGTAEGFYGESDGVMFISLPGPPREMEPMFHNYVLPLLASLKGHSSAKRDEYSTFLIAEAKLEELTEQADSTLDWGTRFQDYRISLYVSGKEQLDRDKAIDKLRSWCGDDLIVSGDHTALNDIRSLLLERGLTLSGAESCTGGLASTLLTEEAGSSEYFLGAVTSYANSAKENILKVPASIIETKGAVSEETAIAMAKGALNLFNSDVAYSITGVAGPAESERKKVGTVCFGFASKDREAQSVCLHFTSWGRASVRRKSTTTAFILLKAYLEGRSLLDTVNKWNYI